MSGQRTLNQPHEELAAALSTWIAELDRLPTTDYRGRMEYVMRLAVALTEPRRHDYAAARLLLDVLESLHRSVVGAMPMGFVCR